MANFALGMNAKIYQGAAATPASGIDPTTLTEMSNVKNVTLSMEAGEADTTTRANSGWRSTSPTLKEATVEFDMQFKTDDASLTAIRTAFLTNGTIALAVLTGSHTVAGNEGIIGNWSITKFDRDENLEEAIPYKVTAKLQEFGQWYTAS
jgi:hypothetical protein